LIFENNTDMKTYSLLAFFAFALFFSVDATAQSRRSMPAQGVGLEQTPGQIRKSEKKDFVEATVEYLEKQLTLDGFQKAVITNIFNDHREELMAAGSGDVPSVEKVAKAQEVTDKIDVEVLKVLSKPQTEKYLKMKEERQKKALKH
jgi:hypothetical protein